MIRQAKRSDGRRGISDPHLWVRAFLPLIASAEDVGGTGIDPPISVASIPDLIDKILQVIVNVGMPVVAIGIVIVGLMFVKARGNEQELITAKQAFLWTVIGAGIVLGAFVISEMIKATVGSITP